MEKIHPGYEEESNADEDEVTVIDYASVVPSDGKDCEGNDYAKDFCNAMEK